MADLKVTETPKPVIPKGHAPDFIHRISDCELCEGEEVLFECKVSGDPLPEITWIKDGKLVQEDIRHRITSKSDGTCTLIVTDVKADDDAVFTCTAKNALGMVSSTAELIVEFEDVPKAEEPTKAETVQATVQHKESPLKDEPRPVPREKSTSERTTKEEIVEVKNNGGVPKDEIDSIVKTREEEVDAEPPVNYHHQPRRSSLQASGSPTPKPPEFILRPRSQHITPPETARLCCMVKGYPTPKVTWQKNTKVLKDEGRFEIYKDGGEDILEIYDTVEEDAGRYTCVIANEHGRTTSSANIAVHGKITRDVPPRFTQRMTNSRTKDGDTSRFSCRVTGEPAPTIQWLFLGKEISPDDDIYEISFDGEKATLVLPEVLPEDEGEYECIARNRAGEVSCRARLSVEIPPTEPSEPAEPVAPAGQLQQLKKRAPWELERKTSRTEIFLQVASCNSSESEDEVIKSKVMSKRKEKVMKATEDVTTKQDRATENGSNYKSSVVKKQKEEPKPVEIDLEPEEAPVLEAKLPEDLVPHDRYNVEPESVTVQIESSLKETPSTFELKLNLESESESEPEESLRIVEPAQAKVERETENHVTTSDDAEMEPEPEPSSGVETEPEIAANESPELAASTDNGESELVISDTELEPEVKVASKDREEAVPSVVEVQSKPEFLQTPSNVEVIDGSPLALTVKVKGNPAPDVMWIFDNCEILEDDDFKLLHDGELHSLVIREVYPEDAGIYYCKAFNAAGEEQCSAKIDVKDPVCQGSPPKFTQKPRSVTVDEGSSLKLACKVEGDPEPAITWSKDGRVISPSQRILIKKLGIGNLRILQIPTALATDAGAYTCVISNANGEEKSTVSVVVHPLDEEQTDFRQLLKSRPRLQNMNNNNTFISSTDKSSPESDAQQLDFRHVLKRHVQTKISPKFTEGLKDMRIKEGETAVFQCQVEGTPGPTIAWTVDGREIKESKYFKMTNDGSLAKLTITEAFPEDEGEYSCIASNTAGQDKTTSDLKIILWEDVEVDDDTRPQESKRDNLDEVFKRSLTISEDDDDEVANPDTLPPAITVTEASPKKSKKVPPPVPAKKMSLERARAPSFDETDKPLETLRSEAVVAEADTNWIKTNKDHFTKPHFALELCNKRIIEGNAAVLECEVTGDPEPDIFWYRDGEEIQESSKYRYEFEGEHGVSLVVNNATMSDCGSYTCKAVNAAGSAESSAQLIGGVPAKIEAGPKNIEVISGQTVSISCKIAGSPEPEVTWTKYRTEVEESERKHMDVTESLATLIIRLASEEDAGRYNLSVSNELGVDNFEISVNVVDKPDPPSGTPTASAISRTSLTLSWSGVSYDGGSRITGYVVEMCRADDKKWQPVTTTISTSHVIPDLQPEVEYLFRVSAENVHGVSEPSLVSNPVLTVDEAPRVKDEKTSGESDDDIDEFTVHGDVTITTDKVVGDVYDIKEQVGKGRFGVVYRCVEKATGKNFAAKFIKTKPSGREAVRAEIHIMNELHHPKLLQCVDAYEVPKQIIMVMEFIAGGELFERVIDDDFVLTEKDAIKFMRQICAGVHYMHEQNILHLDLKPENVMCVDTHGCRIKLIDFGLARKFDPTKSTKVLFGTPEFVAPEVINYEQIGFATDLWSIGVICYILLSGLSPFMGDSDAETLTNVTLAEWDFDDEAFDDISDESKEFIEELLLKKKEKRMTISECLQHTWLNKDIKTMKATKLSTAKLKKFVARRRWQKTTTAVRAIGRMASLTMFAGLKKSGDQPGAAMRPGSPTQSLLKSTLKKETEEMKKSSRLLHREDNGSVGEAESRKVADVLPRRTDTLNGGKVNSEQKPSGIEVNQSVDDTPSLVRVGRAEHLEDSTEKDSPSHCNQTSRSSVNGFVKDDKMDPMPSLMKQSNDSQVAGRSFPPKFTKEIIDAMVFEGDCARFDCHIEGDPEPEVTWYQDDEELEESKRFLMEFDSEGACSLIIKNVIEDDDAEYMVKAVNSAGEASSTGELIVHVPGTK